MFESSDRRHTNVNLMSKRNLEENDKNRVNYGNNWSENTFDDNNKRVKRDSLWTPQVSQGNGLTATDPIVQSTHDMSDNMEDTDVFNDGLDEFVSQAVDVYTQRTSGNSSLNGHNSQQVTTSDQNMISQTTTVVKSDEDVSMNTNPNPSQHQSSNNSEASEGRLKILESRCLKLNEEVFKYKTQSIQTQHRMVLMEREHNKTVKEMSTNFDSAVSFDRNEKQFQTHLLIQLQSALKVFAPNAPIVKTTAEYLNQRKKAFLQDFSQTKLQEFYGPLSLSLGLPPIPTQSQNTPQSGGDILVAESQSTIGAKRPRLSDGFPSQIASTQMVSNDGSMNSLPQPMDTQSVPSNELLVREADSSQAMSQNQSLQIIWNPIRVVLEHKFCSDQKLLNHSYFEPLKEFDDQWIRDNSQIDNWSTNLKQLVNELGLKIQPIVRF